MKMILMKDLVVRVLKKPKIQLVLHQNRENVHTQEQDYLKVLGKTLRPCCLSLVSSKQFKLIPLQYNLYNYCITLYRSGDKIKR